MPFRAKIVPEKMSGISLKIFGCDHIHLVVALAVLPVSVGLLPHVRECVAGKMFHEWKFGVLTFFFRSLAVFFGKDYGSLAACWQNYLSLPACWQNNIGDSINVEKITGVCTNHTKKSNTERREHATKENKID